MNEALSSSELRNEVIGKRIRAVVARPGRPGGPPMVMLMYFDDGSAVEFVSPRSDRVLRRALSVRRTDHSGQKQLPLSGITA